MDDEQKQTNHPNQERQDYPGSAGARIDYEAQAAFDADDFLYTQMAYGEIPEVSLSALRTEDYKKLTGSDKPYGHTDERWHP